MLRSELIFCVVVLNWASIVCTCWIPFPNCCTRYGVHSFIARVGYKPFPPAEEWQGVTDTISQPEATKTNGADQPLRNVHLLLRWCRDFWKACKRAVYHNIFLIINCLCLHSVAVCFRFLHFFAAVLQFFAIFQRAYCQLSVFSRQFSVVSFQSCFQWPIASAQHYQTRPDQLRTYGAPCITDLHIATKLLPPRGQLPIIASMPAQSWGGFMGCAKEISMMTWKAGMMTEQFRRFAI